MKEPNKSIYQQAAEWGIPFGLYLAATAITAIFSDWFAPLSFLFLVLLLATPLVVYYFQRRRFIDEDGFSEYASLWMLGILLFLLGILISGLIIYLVLQYVRPDFMYDQAQLILDTYRDIPEMRDNEMLKVLQLMVDKRLMPTPIQTVVDSFWFISFGGCVLSAITALVAHRPLKRHRNQQRQ